MLIVNEVVSWRIGEPLPVVADVFEFSVDGDELEYLNDALSRVDMETLPGPSYTAPDAWDAQVFYFALARAMIRGRGRVA